MREQKEVGLRSIINHLDHKRDMKSKIMPRWVQHVQIIDKISNAVLVKGTCELGNTMG